ncbi:hypothetical protein NEFER03_2264, partial [Nematocida sp. LUAm3]
MKLLVYIFGLFFYMIDVLASTSTEMLKGEEKELREKLVSMLDHKHTNFIIVPVIHLESGKVITPNMKYKDITTEHDEYFKYVIYNIGVRIGHYLILNDSIGQLFASLKSIPEINNHYIEYRKHIDKGILQALNQYKQNKQTFKEFLDNLMNELINKEQISKNYIEKSVEILINLDQRVNLIENKKSDGKEPLLKEEETLYMHKENIRHLLYLYIFLNNSNYIKNTIQLQKELADCVAARFAMDNIIFQSTIKQWFMENGVHETNFIMLIGLDANGQNFYNSLKKESLAAAGELIIYCGIYNKLTITWKDEELKRKADEILKNIKKQEEHRKKIEEELIAWDKEEEKRKRNKGAKPKKKKKTAKTKKEAGKKAEKELSKKDLEEEQTEEQNSEEDNETSTQEIEHALKNQDINPKQLALNSNTSPNPYTFHPRVFRWSSNNLDTLQAKINQDPSSAYHNQPISSLLFMKHLHDIFPVISIFNSEYRKKFFYKSIDPTKIDGYLADGVMTIKEHAENSKERTIKGQVEIGFTNYKENQIFHLYFKPLSEKGPSIVKNDNSQDYGQEDSNSGSEEDFTYAGSLIYTAEFIRKDKDGDILIVFPKTNITGHPAVTKTLLLTKRNKNRNVG